MSKQPIRFPFEPYAMQVAAMEAIRNDVEAGRVSVVEAPTGTGKSHILLNSILAWYTEHFEANCQPPPDTTRIEQITTNGQKVKWKKRRTEDADLSGDESSSKSSASESSDADEGEGPLVKPKVYISSRTHSQLAQLTMELGRTPYAKEHHIPYVHFGSRMQLCINRSIHAAAHGNGERLADLCTEAITATRLAKPKARGRRGRKQASTDDIEDLAARQTCSFCDANKVSLLQAHLRAKPRPLAEAVELGERVGGCPFLASRGMVRESALVFLPYAYLIDERTRNSILSGPSTNDVPKEAGKERRREGRPDFSGDVLVFDEAHNVADAARASTTSEIHKDDLEAVSKAVCEYAKLYETRLLAANKQKLRELVSLLDRLTAYIAKEQHLPPPLSSSSSGRIETISDFTFAADIDNVNVFSLLRFLEVSHLPQKLQGFVAARRVTLGNDSSTSDASPKQATLHAAYKVQAFLEALGACTSEWSRILIRRDGVIRAIVCDISRTTAGFVDAQSIVFAGGTLQPLSLSIFPLLSPDLRKKTILHTFGHVIPSESLLVASLGSGPGQEQIELTHANKERWDLQLRDAALAVANFCYVIPRGVIVCFPSYAMEAQFFVAAEKFGHLQRIGSTKRVFREDRHGGGSSAEALVASYSAHIRQSASAGALLSCVMGGKLSEGISFNDELARGVIVIGVPFANPDDPELQCTLRFCAAADVSSPSPDGERQLYTALCMRQVNQAIGRCIRHVKDYAVVILLDRRFGSSSLSSRLPNWMQPSLRRMDSFGDAFRAARNFFAEHEQQNM